MDWIGLDSAQLDAFSEMQRAKCGMSIAHILSMLYTVYTVYTMNEENASKGPLSIAKEATERMAMRYALVKSRQFQNNGSLFARTLWSCGENLDFFCLVGELS